MARNHLLFVGGDWRPGARGHRLDLIDPATERGIGQVACAAPDDIDDALAAAAGALDAWRARAPDDRGRILLDAADLLDARLDAAAADLSEEQGKTVAEARGEYARAVETLQWYGANAADLCAPVALDRSRTLVPSAVGVVAAFTPWNYPAVLNARKLAAPLVAGCTVILKAAEEAPSAGCHLVEVLHEAGAPAGVVNLLFGDPPEISRRLVASAAVKALTFTGSTRVGKQLAALAAANLQRCVLELGGHSPVIVCADTDLPAAARAICDYKFECAGQSCNAPSRVIVEATVYERFLEHLVAMAGAIRVGDGRDPATDMGPMANARRIEAMRALIGDAVDRGANVLIGGAEPAGPGFFWPPTILTDVPADARILREEPFGPVLAVSRFEDFDDAIRQANTTDYGLASYVFTASRDRRAQATAGLAVGSVSFNRLKGIAADAPNCGIDDSGYGYEGGMEGLREFQYLKLVNH
ncbi:aldehyde dehydrogenase family protein [Microbaculum marinum]|uniref:Aldehyde dehydrogenase family protein n=1 Tax=Microbaculum marinum TaxID=1764581 RepID=A0AAW9RFB1_9HYPH